MDKYGYIGIETLLNFCENSKDHSVTPNDFMRMNRVRMPERKKGEWLQNPDDTAGEPFYICSQCGHGSYDITKFCPYCGSLNGGD